MLCDLPVWKQYFSGAYRIYPLFHKARGYVTREGRGRPVLVLRTHSPLIPLHATSLVGCRISFFSFFHDSKQRIFILAQSKLNSPQKTFSFLSQFSIKN